MDQVLMSGSWTHSSWRRRRILALASASSTLRCCLLSVRRRLGDSLGDWAQGGGGGPWPQSLSWVSSTIVCGQKRNITISHIPEKGRFTMNTTKLYERTKYILVYCSHGTVFSIRACPVPICFREYGQQKCATEKMIKKHEGLLQSSSVT